MEVIDERLSRNSGRRRRFALLRRCCERCRHRFRFHCYAARLWVTWLCLRRRFERFEVFVVVEEAVAARVEEAKAEVTAELTKSLEESFQAKLAEEVESAKSEAKKEALEESAQAFTAKIDELTAKNVELEESMKEAQAEAEIYGVAQNLFRAPFRKSHQD